jgi:uncharacterized protein YaeQ
MALKATICKATVQVADMDRHYYGGHALTIARHPSETDERMMVRVLCYALHANEALAFGKGLSTGDEPDLWQKDLTGAIESWIDVGQPDERRVRKACGRAREVHLYAYGDHGVGVWWSQMRGEVGRCRNLTVKRLPGATVQALGRLAGRNMDLHCTIQDGHVWLSDGADTVEVLPETLQAPDAS